MGEAADMLLPEDPDHAAWMGRYSKKFWVETLLFEASFCEQLKGSARMACYE
jgi:hypothetical protein